MSLELQELKERLDNFNPNNYKFVDGITKEGLQEKYDRCKEVYDTVTIRELTLIWFLRNSRKGVDMSFLGAAKLNYEAQQALRALLRQKRKSKNRSLFDEIAI